MHVLLVESDPVIANSLIGFMNNQSMTVGVASSAQDAIAQCDATLPDVIVLDTALTGHSGIEFLHEFRSYHEWSHVPVVVWSMQQVTHTQQQALQRLGVSVVLYKPKTTLQHLAQQLQTFQPAHA